MAQLPSNIDPKSASGSGNSGIPRNSELCIRINAFMSLKSPNTQRTYSSIIREWCSFLHSLAKEGNTADLFISATDLHAIAYRSWLQERPGQRPRLKVSRNESKDISTTTRKANKLDGMQSTLSNATIAKKFAALRRIYRMLISYDLGVTRNPFDTERVPAPPAKAGQKRPTEMIDFSMVKRIVDIPNPAEPKGLRDKAILSLLFGAGLRRSEVVNIRLGDIKQTRRGNYFVHLRSTKARKDADQAFPAWAAETVCELVTQRRKQGGASGDYLFLSFKGRGGLTQTDEPLSDSGLYKLFKKYCILSGAGNIPSPHSARATAITKLLQDGVSHREVQEFSRHASVQMVEVYDKRRIDIDENPATKLEYD